MQIRRLYTQPGEDTLARFSWETRHAQIVDAEGHVLFAADVEVPAHWSQSATDILASKYLRRTGVPQPDGSLGKETSAKQAFRRLVGWWRHIGEVGGYFSSPEDAQAFEDELLYMLGMQMFSPNSPQWFNAGLAHAYKIHGPAQGHWYTDPSTGETLPAADAYTYPQTSACFIQSVQDDLVNPGGIMDLWVRESRIFKYGSGTGTNFSSLRGVGERLSGGGTTSGLMSWLKIGDRAAGAVKSGGTTRRAAKMVILEIDHPDIEAFINWKVEEERKVRVLVAQGYSARLDGEAYETVSGQNSNNSVRVSHAFMRALAEDGTFNLTYRTTGEAKATLRACDLWEKAAHAAWEVGDPGLQFDTLEDWNTTPHVGPIRGTNPCSEYAAPDDTACNLASLNLVKFIGEDGAFAVEEFSHAVRLATVVLEITLAGSGFPSEAIARNSYRLRALGLGYTNLGGYLMRMGLPYDSPRGRAQAAAITALMTARAYAASAEMARDLEPYAAYDATRHLAVLANHARAARGEQGGYVRWDGTPLVVPPQPLDHSLISDQLSDAVVFAWEEALASAEARGLRNSQVTLLAPTGTIAFLMDCDTTGVEPDYALVKYKKLVGGGSMKIVNQSVEPALRRLGYSEEDINETIAHVLGIGDVAAAFPELEAADAVKVQQHIEQAANLKEAFRAAGVQAPTMEAGAWRWREYEIMGAGTLEGAPRIKDEDLAVFDCASAGSGSRYIAPMGHVAMLGAVQPFLSGGISKTVNLPHEATPEDFVQVFEQAYRSGVKAVAVYRDASKVAQPLSSGSKDADAAQAEAAKPSGAHTDGHGLARGEKRKLPSRRLGATYELTVGGQKLFVRTGEYEDGEIGEVFIDIHKEGSAVRSLMNQIAILASRALQHGMSVEDLVETFVFTKFEPGGVVTGHPNVKMATSILDAVGRILGYDYIGREDLVQVPSAPAGPATGMRSVDGAAAEAAAAVVVADPTGGRTTGDGGACPNCGHTMIRTGTCTTCPVCGTNTGCGG